LGLRAVLYGVFLQTALVYHDLLAVEQELLVFSLLFRLAHRGILVTVFVVEDYLLGLGSDPAELEVAGGGKVLPLWVFVGVGGDGLDLVGVGLEGLVGLVDEAGFGVPGLLRTLRPFRRRNSRGLPAFGQVLLAEVVLTDHFVTRFFLLPDLPPLWKPVSIQLCVAVDRFFKAGVAGKCVPHHLVLSLEVDFLELVEDCLVLLAAGFDFRVRICVSEAVPVQADGGIDVGGEYGEEGAVLLALVFVLFDGGGLAAPGAD
jgi:hypothetical protein